MKSLIVFSLLLLAITAFSQDAITLKNGDEIKGKVIKVGISEIEYKKDSTSPVYAIEKSKVFMIKYENGSRDVLANLETIEQGKPALNKKLTSEMIEGKMAGGSVMIIAGVGLIVGAIGYSESVKANLDNSANRAASESSRRTNTAVIASLGCILTVIGIPILSVGVHQKRLYESSNKSVSLIFSDRLGLAYNF